MSRELDLSRAEWVKSSYSGGDGGQCVEFSPSFAWEKSSYSGANGGQRVDFFRSPAPSGMVPVRDSKNMAGAALIFPAGGWNSFVTAVGSGELAG
jgi:hypothetical protein